MTWLISLVFCSCISISRSSIDFLIQILLRYVFSVCPMRNTRQKACCSAPSFHQGSTMMTLCAIVRFSPTAYRLADFLEIEQRLLTATTAYRGEQDPRILFVSESRERLVASSKRHLAGILQSCQPGLQHLTDSASKTHLLVIPLFLLADSSHDLDPGMELDRFHFWYDS